MSLGKGAIVNNWVLGVQVILGMLGNKHAGVSADLFILRKY
jgi:hypothetical protein